MTSSKVANAAAKYERRVAHIHSLLEYHPEFRMSLPYKELAIFDRYFLPDWVSVGNFFRHYVRLRDADPDIDRKMDAAFERFHQVNGIPLPKSEHKY